jgi:hypothetical protein
MRLRQARYRALVTLDKTGSVPAAREYPNHTRALVVRACRLGMAGHDRHFRAEICRDDEQPLHPGDHAVVTLTITGEEVAAFFGAGQRFTLWNGREVGHGIIARKVYTDSGPS